MCCSSVDSLWNILRIRGTDAYMPTLRKVPWYTAVNRPVINWQSIRSITPPWPGMTESKSLRLYVRLIAEAKKPPKGAMSDVKAENTNECSWIGRSFTCWSERWREIICGTSYTRGRKIVAGLQSRGATTHCNFSKGQTNQVYCSKWAQKDRANELSMRRTYLRQEFTIEKSKHQCA